MNTLKANQGTLFAGAAFANLGAGAMASRHTSYRELDRGHRRLEVRSTTLLDDPTLLAWLSPVGAWADLARVVAERRTGDLRSRKTRYFSTSLTAAIGAGLPAKRGGDSVHWVLDRAFRKNLCRVRTGCFLTPPPEPRPALRHQGPPHGRTRSGVPPLRPPQLI